MVVHAGQQNGSKREAIALANAGNALILLMVVFSACGTD
jgi:hypothetical protein